MRIDRSTLVHLRFHFSYFLTPMYSIALILTERIHPVVAVASFAVVHLLLYPASNAFNSYYDKDEGSIGGIEHPPPVTRQLLYTALIFDALAVVFALLIGPIFGLLVFVYGLGSKAYSWDKIRLKKHPIASWLAIAFGQGAATIVMFHLALDGGDFAATFTPRVLIVALIGSLFLMASYPLTQVYQHEEDRKRGDRSISLLLGIRGTFYFCALFFTAVMAGFAVYFTVYDGVAVAAVFIAAQLPTLVFFLLWFVRVLRNEEAANFRSTMWINLISATGLNLFCVLFLIFWR